MNRGGGFHNFQKLAKMAIFPKNPRRKKKLTLKVVTQPPQFRMNMAHGYPSKSKILSYFIKPFMMNKNTFHTGTKGLGENVPFVSFLRPTGAFGPFLGENVLARVFFNSRPVHFGHFGQMCTV